MEFNKVSSIDITPTSNDLIIFSKIIDIILSAQENDTLKKEVANEIKDVFSYRSNIFIAQTLLETLGFCSILDTPQHKGVLNEYINLANAPSKRPSSEWAYPVDFGVGKDGINKDAFKFWFGEYAELERFWKI